MKALTMKYLILVGAFLAFAGPANAQNRCSRPYAPAVNVTAATSARDFAQVGADIRSFIAASDIYQTCLTSRLRSSESSRLISTNQADKQRVAAEYNAALRTRR